MKHINVTIGGKINLSATAENFIKSGKITLTDNNGKELTDLPFDVVLEIASKTIEQTLSVLRDKFQDPEYLALYCHHKGLAKYIDPKSKEIPPVH